ncbi:hypothetical protein [Microterricola pindariensis]|uniref:hypothetical protein n=1 Tax=Microterricola pindariensis TaxID=478010 RepID=UPI001057435B|nr:hypothetical protein [Microterricola pindariensis]
MRSRFVKREWMTAAAIAAIGLLGGLALSLTVTPSYLANITIEVSADGSQPALARDRISHLARQHTGELAGSFTDDGVTILALANGSNATAFAEGRTASIAVEAAKAGALRFASAVRSIEGPEGTHFGADVQGDTSTARLSSPHPLFISTLGLLLGLLVGTAWLYHPREGGQKRTFRNPHATTRDRPRP